MGKKHSHGSVGRGDTLSYRPEDLKVITDEKHPLYDKRVTLPVNEGYVLSIMEHGILQPLVIYRDGADVYVNSGLQRRKAAIEANKRLKKQGLPEVTCPCVWKRGDEKKLYAIAVTTNELRQSDPPLLRAQKMQHMVDLYGGDVDHAAVAFGCTAATVRNHLALLECAPAVQKAVETGKVAASIAKKLSKLARTDQVKTLDKMIATGATKGAAAQHASKGDAAKPFQKVMSTRERTRVAKILRDKSMAQHTNKANSDAAEAMAAMLDFVGGDAKALDAYPAIVRWLRPDEDAHAGNGSVEAQA